MIKEESPLLLAKHQHNTNNNNNDDDKNNNNKTNNNMAIDLDAIDDDQEPRMCSPLSCFVGILSFPASLLSCLVVDTNEEIVLLDYGKYNGTMKEPGCHWVCMAGRTMHRVSTKVQSILIPETKTIDKNGNPLVINGVLSYQVSNAKKSVIDVENASTFVKTQGLAAMKQIVSKYPYEADDEHCLKTNADYIAQSLVHVLQQRVRIAGIKIITFTFNEISYAPEIAAGMLKRQQANAILQARQAIVSGAVDIVKGAIHEMEERGVVMDDKTKVQVTSNLLTVLCSESK